MSRSISRWALVVVTLALTIPAGIAAAQRPPDTLIALVSGTMTGWRPGSMTGVERLTLYNSPLTAGPYVVRSRFQSGLRIGPHYHDSTVTITVMSGVLHLGIGSATDTAAARVYPPGSFLVLPARTPHFEWFEGETVVQLSGTGPLGQTNM